MVLRVSAKVGGDDDVNVRAVEGGDAADDSGVEHGRELVDFATAIAARDAAAIRTSRDALVAAAGEAAMIDAAAVAGNFQRMSRIADSTGIPLDKVALVMSHDVRQELNVDKYATAGNADRNQSLAVRLFSPLLSRVATRFLPLLVGKK